jgi:hypothetical protein
MLGLREAHLKEWNIDTVHLFLVIGYPRHGEENQEVRVRLIEW